MLSQPMARRVRLEASRFSSAGSQLCPQPVPILSGRRKRAACLPQTASETSPEERLLFPVPEQSFPVAGDTLQTWPTGICSCFYFNATSPGKCPVFFADIDNEWPGDFPVREVHASGTGGAVPRASKTSTAEL